MPPIDGNKPVSVLINAHGEELGVHVERAVPVAKLSDAIKYQYMKIYVCLVQKHANDIGAQIGKINILMARIECNLEVRRKIRELLADGTQQNLGDALHELMDVLPYIEREGIKYSILKDVIWFSGIELRNKKPEEQLQSVESKPHVKEISSLLGITQEQVEVILQAMSLDQAILSGDLTDSMLTSMAKDLASKAAGVGVPLAALYLSGTMGLSAAGITSALAFLGFGGILGLSSMVTGIGVLVLAGVGIYQGVKYATGAGERDAISKRGLMLRLILQNQQQTITNMAEDVFDLTSNLKDLMVDAAKNQKLIDKILAKMAQIQAAADYVRKLEEESKKEIAIEDGKADA